jgi:hypothetical protein
MAGQHRANVDLATVEMDGGNKPVFVPANVKHNIVVQLGFVALDEHDIVAPTLHHAVCDGALWEQGIHGNHPALQLQAVQHFFQNRDLICLVRHGLLPQGQPQPVAESSEEMDGGGSLLVTTQQRFPINGQGFRLAWSQGQRREDAFRPWAQRGFHQVPGQLAQDVRQGRRTGRLSMGKAQGPRQLLPVAAAHSAIAL